MTWIKGDVSGSETLTSSDHLYETHINQLRESNLPTAVVGTTPNSQYYCDGTADDVQIQAAIDALGTGGGTVFIKKGTYLLNEMIQLVQDGITDKIHLCGESRETTILKMANGVNKLGVIGGKADGSGGITTTGVVIENLTLDFNGANQTTALIFSCLAMNTFEKSIVRNCKFLNCYAADGVAAFHYGIGVNTFDADHSVIEDCYISNCDYGLWITTANLTDNHDLLVNNNIIEDSIESGINHESGVRTIVTNNIVLNSGGSGIVASAHLDNKTECVFANNIIYNSGSYGGYFVGYKWIIKDNIVLDSGTTGISAACQDSIVSGNIIHNVGLHTATITLKDGITLGRNYINCSNNIIYDDQATSTMVNGIYVSTDYCKMVNNDIKNCLYYGIQNLGSYNTISDNQVMDCGLVATNTVAAIILSTASKVSNKVTGNTIISTGVTKMKYGIQEGNASNDYNIILHNIIKGAGTSALSLLASNDIVGLNQEIT